MSKDNSADGSSKTRPALGDLTNRPLKRGISKISTDSDAKSVDGNGDKNLRKIVKIASSGEENTKEDCNPKGVALPNAITTDLHVVSPICSGGDSTNGNNVSVVELVDDIGEKVSDSVMEVGDASRDNHATVAAMSVCSDGGGERGYEKAGQTLVDAQSTPELGNAVGKVMGTAFGSNEWSKIPTSLGGSMVRCMSLSSAADLNAGDESLDDCSCSFCLQAGHILSDLQYKDIKGRITALKKSQKEAGLLVQKSFREKENDLKVQRSPKKISKLESDLSSQWRSLFLHMEDIFVNEGNHLHDKFVTLRDLRDNCKMELEAALEAP